MSIELGAGRVKYSFPIIDGEGYFYRQYSEFSDNRTPDILARSYFDYRSIGSPQGIKRSTEYGRTPPFFETQKFTVTDFLYRTKDNEKQQIILVHDSNDGWDKKGLKDLVVFAGAEKADYDRMTPKERKDAGLTEVHIYHRSTADGFLEDSATVLTGEDALNYQRLEFVDDLSLFYAREAPENGVDHESIDGRK